jgi:hypothetical protein
MDPNLEHFTLILATGILVCLGLIIIWNATFNTRGLDVIDGYKPKKAFYAVALAVAFVVGFLAEDAFDDGGPSFLDREEAKFWQPIDSYIFMTQSTPKRSFFGLEKIEKFLIPVSKEKLRFESLFGINSQKKKSTDAGNSIDWYIFAKNYLILNLFSKFVPEDHVYDELNNSILTAIKEGRRIPLEQCRADGDCPCYRIIKKCYPPESVNRYIKLFVNQTFYHSKNLIYINKNYFDELTDRERRVGFSRSITYVSILFFTISFALLLAEILVWSVRKIVGTATSFSNIIYLILPTITFFSFAFLAKQANQFEQDQLNRRVFGYTTSLALLADKSERKNAFERYFLGLGSDSGNFEQADKPPGM